LSEWLPDISNKYFSPIFSGQTIHLALLELLDLYRWIQLFFETSETAYSAAQRHIPGEPNPPNYAPYMNKE
jgi:hypothetical protein